MTPTSSPMPLSSLLVVVALVCLYLLPSLIAAARGVHGVARLNLLAGWTGVGWVLALVRACRHRRPTEGARQWR